MKRDQNILFLCNHNSARSQMAEALFRELDQPRFSAASAGLYPRPLSEGAIRAMNEIGIDIGQQRSKSTKEFLGRQVVHHAIFLCSESEDDCPRLFPFASHLHYWKIPSPTALSEQLGSEAAAFRKVRDIIDQKIREWIAGLDVDAA